MTDHPSADPGGGLDRLPDQAAQAAASIDGVKSSATAAAASIDAAFAKAGESLAKTLAKAAADGKVSLGELASAVIQAADVFARSSAGGSATTGLADALGGVLKSVFSGARADGGPVGSGGAYLVGERGPELFRPSTAGEVSPLGGGGGTVVNVTVQGGGAPSILRSEAQISAALARAVRMGAG